MILEGIVTTRNRDGGANVAPMGPLFRTVADGTPDFGRFTLRPFRSSLTFANLARDRCGVFHLTDDVLLLARAAVHADAPPPAVVPADAVAADRLADCCRYFEFVVETLDESAERSTLEVRVVASGRVRDFVSLNRGKHAVVEAAILATRVHLLPAEVLRDEIDRLRPLVEKTGGPAEREAFALLERRIRDAAGGAQQ